VGSTAAKSSDCLFNAASCRLGDWDEALIIGRNPDGTYVLEYVDEGLIEENVPASRIRLPGADPAPPPTPAPAADGFSEGATVEGNFKGSALAAQATQLQSS
jgi:hypothetical protein